MHFGFIGPYFPPMVWPIFLSISLIDDELLEASRDLGGHPRHTLRHIIIPLAIPGVVAGIVFTFVPMLGDTVVAHLIGDGRARGRTGARIPNRAAACPQPSPWRGGRGRRRGGARRMARTGYAPGAPGPGRT